MRTYDSESVESIRPHGDRAHEDTTEPIGRAAAGNRPDVLGAAGLLALQRAAGNAGVSAMMSADEVIPTGGTPLDASVRGEMESRFGEDFGDVRVHSGADAHASAVGLSAQAYTVGSDIVFQQGRYDPGSADGAHMLAHELTHVVQQRSGPVDGTDNGGGVRVSDPSDSFERAASANADQIMSMPASSAAASGPASSVQRHGDEVQRDGDEEQVEAQRVVQREDEPEEADDAEA
jgi:Domain of unknown function (DUF4157)